MSRPARERRIDSPRNPAIQRARSLERDPGLRQRERAFVAWGRHLALEALRAGAPIREAFVTDALDASAEGPDILRDLAAAAAPVVRTTPRVLESIVEGSGDQGVLLVVARPQRGAAAILGTDRALAVALHGVQDPGNVGSILRTSLALGASGLAVLPGCADPFGSRAVRAGMGAQFRLPVLALAPREFLELVDRSGLQMVAADGAGRDPPTAVDLTVPTVLLLGSEASGLPAELLHAARRSIRIPMAPGVDSLNVHAAAAALLYEASRQRGFRQDP